MNVDEARTLIGTASNLLPEVEVKRRGGTWVGHVVGVVTEPCLILEQADGKRVTIALSETTADPLSRTGRPTEDS